MHYHNITYIHTYIYTYTYIYIYRSIIHGLGATKSDIDAGTYSDPKLVSRQSMTFLEELTIPPNSSDTDNNNNNNNNNR